MYQRIARKIQILLLLTALCVNLLPGAVFAARITTYEEIGSTEELTTGRYVLQVQGGIAAGCCSAEEYPRVSAVFPNGNGQEFPDPENALWTLTVTESGVILTDPAGIPIAPPETDENGLRRGQYLWTVSFDGGKFRFRGMAGQTPVLLAYNTEIQAFRAYDSFTAEGYPEGYLTDFTLYRMTETETEPEESIPEEEILPPEPAKPKLYFGQLHAHSRHSDGTLTLEETFAAAREAGLDYFGLTDHGDSLTPEEWNAVQTGSCEGLLVLRGYEMSWPQELHLGHITAFGTEDFRSWQEEPYRTYAAGLENYYTDLARQPAAVGQFCHPGSLSGDFKAFSRSEEADKAIHLLEVVSEEGRHYDAYTAALDAGWHVAPANNGDAHRPGSTGRTVAELETLTEETLYTALKNHRVYATEDNDLALRYTLNGYPMGSMLEGRQVGETVTLETAVQDATDEKVGLVEVITEGGRVLASRTPEANPALLSIPVPAGYAYYYLRITQPDGDVAVTAPVWIDSGEDVGISALTCSPSVPVQGEPVELTVSLFNEEATALQVQSIRFLAQGQEICLLQEPFPVAPGTTVDMTASYTHGGLGAVTVTAVVTATLDGQVRTYEERLQLHWRRQDLVSGILVDGTHGNAGVTELKNLTALAGEKNIDVTVETGAVTEEALADCAMLLVSAPEEPFSPEFLQAVSEFVGFGGSLMVCADPGQSPQELNRLLEAVGAAMRFREETAAGIMTFNTEAELCAGVHGDRRWYPEAACTLENGTWLVRGEGTVFAFEDTAGGRVYACGSLFLKDAATGEEKHIWEEPYANRTLLKNLLGIGQRELPLATLREARMAEGEQVFRLRGYVTAGTSNPYNTFPQTLYLQDNTGGIAVMPFGEAGIPVCTALEIIGSPAWREGERVLDPISWEILDYPLYNYQPKKLTCAQTADYDAFGGCLVQAEGICRGVTYREDGTLSSLTLKDSAGKTVIAVIEDGIGSGATGRNDLHRMVKTGREFRVTGLLAATESGTTRIRVRNCDEVVYISPIPYTGDRMERWMAALLLSALSLMLLTKKNCRP